MEPTGRYSGTIVSSDSASHCHLLLPGSLASSQRKSQSLTLDFKTDLKFISTSVGTFRNPLAEFPDLCKHYVETVAVYYGIAPTLILYSCISVFGFLTLKRLWSASKNRKELQAAGTSVGKPFYKR